MANEQDGDKKPYVDPNAHVIQVSKDELKLYQDQAKGTGAVVNEVSVGEAGTYTNNYGDQKQVITGNTVISIGKGDPALENHVIPKIEEAVREKALWDAVNKPKFKTR